jgi:glycosyltransferase involved in cell wall biosynthesis
MQWRLPVVATIEGSIPEIVADGETGYLVPKRDHLALADRLERLITDPARRAEMGDRGRERYLARYTVEQFEQKLSATLARCLNTP